MNNIVEVSVFFREDSSISFFHKSFTSLGKVRCHLKILRILVYKLLAYVHCIDKWLCDLLSFLHNVHRLGKSCGPIFTCANDCCFLFFRVISFPTFISYLWIFLLIIVWLNIRKVKMSIHLEFWGNLKLYLCSIRLSFFSLNFCQLTKFYITNPL